ncbi:MAG: DeoR/GlpR family DNA-binding transcription regulator [Saccharofermentanales bacterium]
MLNLERQQAIFDVIKEKKSAAVEKLAKKFFTSETTIRRDLEKLEIAGLIRRTYGGALLIEGIDTEIPLIVRETENISAKKTIASAAADMVTDDDVIIMDSSSSVLSMVPFLNGKRNLTVITNGAKASVELGNMLHTKVYCTGGLLRENSLSYIGPYARSIMEKLYANKVFFSARSLSLQAGVTDINEEEAELRRIMIKNAKISVLLMDSSKIDTVSFSNVCSLSQINTIITDQNDKINQIDWIKSGIHIIRV